MKMRSAPNRGRLGQHCSEEQKRKLSISNKGKCPSEETRIKMRNSYNPELHKNRKKGITAWNKGLAGYLSGSKHYNWKGGITKIGLLIRGCFKYRQWRSDIFTRDNFTCQWCGKRGGILEVHHIKSFSSIVKENRIKTLADAESCEELWNINNGITLCHECHSKTKYKNFTS